jgi:putative heme-binding domain-containing protein
VGPDITSVASRPKQELLVDILDPSRRVSPDFVAYAAVTTKGVVTTGIIAAETEDSVTLRRERGEQVTFRLSDLVNLQPSHKSIMPDNVEAQLDVQALADLLAVLRPPRWLRRCASASSRWRWASEGSGQTDCQTPENRG